MEKNFYVYSYEREDGTPYYIGKGKNKRAWSKHKHVNPPSDHSRIKLLVENLNEQEAYALEVELIAKFGRKDLGTGILHNRSNGGEKGASGYKHSIEAKAKIASAHKGRIHSEKSRKNMSIGQKGKKYSKEACQNMSNGQKGHIKSPEHLEKIRQANLGKKRTAEQRAKCATFGMLGKKHSPETIEKMKSPKNFIEVQCPHCGLIGKGPNMTRYHFDNCKKSKP